MCLRASRIDKTGLFVEDAPEYRRAFLRTVALIGTINAVLFACFILSPVEVTGSRQKGLEPGAYVRHVPAWVAGSLVMLNLPGGLLAIPLAGIVAPGSWLDSWLPALLTVICGTFFWGLVAMGVEYWRYGRRSP